MKLSDFDYALPKELIAQTPAEPRDSSRLLVLRRQTGVLEHSVFSNIGDFLRQGDLLLLNDTRVIPARLFGKRVPTGGKVELLLLQRNADGTWDALANPARLLKVGERIVISRDEDSSLPFVVSRDPVSSGSLSNHERDSSIHPGSGRTEATITAAKDDGIRTVRFSDESAIDGLGHTPLPPYIQVPLADPERYQTVYSRERGSAAAPTAGLHFTPELLKRLQAKGIEIRYVTLHVGLDTFKPVTEDDPTHHKLHSEFGVLSQDTADAINRARADGRRVICVGTTTTRIVEHAALQSVRPERSRREPVEGPTSVGDKVDISPHNGWLDLMILPGHEFRVVDALITNFHLPKSTLLMLVSAFAGRERVLAAYEEAIRQRYRFYSFGDAMLIL